MDLLKRKLNVGVMQQILDCFVELAGIRVAFFDNFEELVNGKHKPACEFCAAVKQVPALAEGCARSDRDAYEVANKRKGIYVYRCHMGLWEAVVPVTVHGVPAGYLMFGQVKNSESPQDQWSVIEKMCVGLGLPPETIQVLKTAYGEVHELSYEKILAVAKMLDIIARHIIDTNVIHVYDLQAIEKARKSIEQGLGKPISTKAVAEAAGLSPSYMGYLFKRETGETIGNHVAALRLKEAKRLLEETGIPIKEIACRCGYAEQNYFSRVFKKWTGVSPAKYRSECQKPFVRP